MTEREREIVHALVHASYACNNQGSSSSSRNPELDPGFPHGYRGQILELEFKAELKLKHRYPDTQCVCAKQYQMLTLKP